MNRFKKMAYGFLVVGVAAGLFWFTAPLSVRTAVLLPSGHYSPRFRIASDTTYITEPIDAEGYPDYEEAVNRRLSAGIDPEDNRVVALLQATGPNAFRSGSLPNRYYTWLGASPPPDSGDYLVTLYDFLSKDFTLDEEKRLAILENYEGICSLRPWKKKDHPQIAAWIEQNRLPMETAILASQKPKFFQPLIDPQKGKRAGGINEANSILTFVCRNFCPMLGCRAMMELGEKEVLASRRSLLSSLRFVRSCKPKSIIELLVLMKSELVIYPPLMALLENGSLSASDLASLAIEIEAMPAFPPLADLIGDLERLGVLDEAMLLYKTGELREEYNTGLFSLQTKADQITWFFNRSIDISRINQDKTLTIINQWFDLSVADLNIAHPQLRREALERLGVRFRTQSGSARDDLERDAKAWFPRPYSARTMTALVGTELAAAALSTLEKLQKAIDIYEQKRQLLFTSIALARFKRDTGAYPDALASLAPGYLKTIPPDIFTGRLPVYLRTMDGGYLLYSLGPDQADSGGRTWDEDSHSDDIGVKMPRSAPK